MESTHLFIVFSVWKRGHGSGKNVLFYVFITTEGVIIIEEYYTYHVHTIYKKSLLSS
jgi:hypothetical protein